MRVGEGLNPQPVSAIPPEPPPWPQVMSQHTAKALATMKGIVTTGRWILDGACTAMTAYELQMLDRETLEDPGPGVRPLQGAHGNTSSVQLVGQATLTIAHDKGRWRQRVYGVRYAPGLSVNLFPESAIHSLGCSIEWPDGGRKQITLPDGGVCVLKYEHGSIFSNTMTLIGYLL